MDTALYVTFEQLEHDHWWFKARREIVLKIIDHFYQGLVGPSSRVLDIGCGTGGMLAALQAYGQVWGVDPEPQAVAASQRQVPQAHVELGCLPQALPNQQFSLITALDVLEHVPDDYAGLQAIRTHLQVNGLAIITVPAYQWLWAEHDQANQHYRRYTRQELVRKISAAGLQLVYASYFNSLLFGPIALAKLLRRSHVEHMPAPVSNWFWYTLFASEKYVLPTWRLPVGISIIAIVKKTD